MVNIPAPVGGTPLPADFAPSIVFAALYGMIVPLMIYRVFVKRRSRTLLLTGTVTFSIERVVVYSLRAVMSRNEEKRFSHGLQNYMQLSFGMGFIGIANDLINILKCMMVNPTYGSDMWYQSPASNTKDCVFRPPQDGTPDQPRTRFWARRWTDFLNFAFLAATIPGTIWYGQYSGTFDNENKARTVQRIRFESTSVALFLCVLVILTSIWCRIKLNTPRRSIGLMILVSSLMSTVAIYRLSVMGLTTPSITTQTILDKPYEKTLFYIFHTLPEWLAIFVMILANVRKWNGTGLIGDWRNRDWNEKEIKKYREKQAKKGMTQDLSTDAIPLQEKKTAATVSQNQV